jgi:excisionase family DNA binding protein
MRKRNQGVPSYTVPEAAALLSISQEYLYRLIQADGFPALVMRLGRAKGRYVVPAKAVERLLADATDGVSCVDVSTWTDAWHAGTTGGAA